jgi:hypothetical protein
MKDVCDVLEIAIESMWEDELRKAPPKPVSAGLSPTFDEKLNTLKGTTEGALLIGLVNSLYERLTQGGNPGAPR